MTHFIGGPAHGQFLGLGRSPRFLRVARSADGEWDALDQLDDVPRPGEQLHAYRLDPHGIRGIACFRGRGGRRDSVRLAEYRWVEVQPPQEVLRDRQRWQAWCLAQPADEPSPVSGEGS